MVHIFPVRILPPERRKAWVTVIQTPGTRVSTLLTLDLYQASREMPSKQAAPDAVRSLKIKSSGVKRTHKEFSLYQQEVVQESAKLEKMKADGLEKHEMKQQENVVAESTMMIPETRQRLEALVNDLQTFLAQNKEDVEGTEELEAAEEILKAAVETLEG